MTKPKMPTEVERLAMIQLLDDNIDNMDAIIAGMEKNFGIKVTPEEVLALIDFLKAQKGSE